MRKKTAYIVTTKNLISEQTRLVTLSRKFAEDDVRDIIATERDEPSLYEIPLIGDEFLSTDIVYLAVDLSTDEFVGAGIDPDLLRKELGDDVVIIET